MESMPLRREVLPPRLALSEPCGLSVAEKRRRLWVLALLAGVVPAVTQFLERFL